MNDNKDIAAMNDNKDIKSMNDNKDIAAMNDNKDIKSMNDNIVTNARTKIAELLSTIVAGSQSYCVGGSVVAELATTASSAIEPCIPQIVIPKTSSSTDFTLSLPLSEVHKQSLIDFCSRSGVGKTSSTEPVVDLEVRKSWELLPDEFCIANEVVWYENVMTPLLKSIKQKLECEEWIIDAKLYKLLLYEKGCFFSKHRDNERIENMFGTLVIQLPSLYEGAVLRVHSPINPDENKDFDFGTTSTQSNSSNTMNFAAFYADCYHEVSALTEGSRVALVYNLTATPPIVKKRKHAISEDESRADPWIVSKTLPQLPDLELVKQIGKELSRWLSETDEDYSKDLELNNWSNKFLGSVPIKMVAVLSHHYTPHSLLGLNSLKGRDKVVGRLLYDALCCRHSSPDIPTLATSSMEAVMNQKIPQQQLNAVSSESDLVSITRTLLEEAVKPNLGLGLYNDFDVYLSFVAVWDSGELMTDPPLFTFGPKIPLFPDDSQFEQYDTWPSSVDKTLLNSRHKMDLAFRGLFNGEPEEEWGKGRFSEDLVPNDNWGGLGPIKPDQNSMRVYENELLLISETIRKEVIEINQGDERVKDVEFLGNGPCYLGRCYGRVAILFWPKRNRNLVFQQFPAGKKAVQAAAEKASRG